MEPSIKYDRKGKPNWIQKPENAFNPAYYVCGIGSGSSQEKADANAFANLIAYFGQSVESTIHSIQVYNERIINNSVLLQSRDEISSEVKLSSSMNQLIGAKIYDRWKETKKQKTTYHAVAVMEKSEVIRIYTQLIDDNLVSIEKLIAMDPAENTGINAVARYYCAADIADIHTVFKNMLLVLGVSHRSTKSNTPIDYRLLAKNTAAQIPITITVQGDVDGRIKAAFAFVFSEAGFTSGSKDSRYRLDAELKIAPEESSSPYLFSRYTLTASLLDASNKSTVLPFSVSDREGHTTQSSADNRALIAAENKIKTDYAAMFETYLKSTMRIMAIKSAYYVHD
jgi:hypothetical protein